MAQPATTDSPLVVISYHPYDRHWVDRVRYHLELGAVKPRVSLYDMPERPPARNLIGTSLDLIKAKVVVLVISPAYVGSPMSEEHLNGLSIRGVHLLGLVVEQPDLADLSKLPSQVLRVNAVPLAETSAERQNSIFTGLVELIDSFLKQEPTSAPPETKENQRQPARPRAIIAGISVYSR
jgi:hypothetical protein